MLPPTGPRELPPFPYNRFVFYDDLTSADLDRATELGYTEESWELPGEAAVETLAYESQFPAARDIIDEFGWSEETWDVSPSRTLLVFQRLISLRSI